MHTVLVTDENSCDVLTVQIIYAYHIRKPSANLLKLATLTSSANSNAV